jgi:hypothetical protein
MFLVISRFVFVISGWFLSLRILFLSLRRGRQPWCPTTRSLLVLVAACQHGALTLALAMPLQTGTMSCESGSDDDSGKSLCSDKDGDNDDLLKVAGSTDGGGGSHSGWFTSMLDESLRFACDSDDAAAGGAAAGGSDTTFASGVQISTSPPQIPVCAPILMMAIKPV